MRNEIKECTFRSDLASFFSSYVKEKKALGYKMTGIESYLKKFDSFLVGKDCAAGLTKEIVLEWVNPKPHMKAVTIEHNIRILRKFTEYLERNGIPAYCIPNEMIPRADHDFEPYIFTYDEISRIIDSVDSFKYNRTYPRRYLVYPMLFRILCFCGLRISEALNLRVRDVDFNKGYLHLHETKGDRERIIPIDTSLQGRINEYMDRMHFFSYDEFLFPSPDGGRYSVVTIEATFREILYQAGIPYRGKNHGPRLHDLRHTFCVHSLQKLKSNGLDQNAALPILMTYMGHRNISATSRYIHLASESYPEILEKMADAFGNMIPYEEGNND